MTTTMTPDQIAGTAMIAGVLLGALWMVLWQAVAPAPRPPRTAPQRGRHAR